MTFEGLTPIGCVVAVLGMFWGTCFLIALPLFLTAEALDNLEHGSGWFGVEPGKSKRTNLREARPRERNRTTVEAVRLSWGEPRGSRY